MAEFFVRRPIVAMVIAADEGVMPQTREHMEICTLLGVRHGFVALTKIDKLKPNKRTARLRELGGSLPVQADWVIPTSAHTGAGIEPLWRAIDTLL